MLIHLLLFSLIYLMSIAPESGLGNLDVNILLSSFLKIESQNDEFAESFYNALFAKYPQVQKLFLSKETQKQKNKLIESLKLVILNVHNSENLTSRLKGLGTRLQYGTVLTDYPLICDALLQALEKHLGRDWNPQVRQAWTLAYQIISDKMAEGARSGLGNEVTWKTNNEELPAITPSSSTELPIYRTSSLLVHSA